MGLLLSGEEIPDFGKGNDDHAVKDEDSTQEEGRSKNVSLYFLHLFSLVSFCCCCGLSVDNNALWCVVFINPQGTSTESGISKATPSKSPGSSSIKKHG